MKITLPPPVTIKLPDGKTVEYSLPEMARYLARNSRRFGGGNTAEAVRMGKRIDDAFAAPKGGVVELQQVDGAEFKLEIEKPSCGWANLTVTRVSQAGVDAAGKPILRQATQRIRVSGLDVLPLIDAVPTS